MNINHEILSNKGRVEVFEAPYLFLVKSYGVISPDLVKKDLLLAEVFSKEVKGPWTYLVDTKNVTFAHPLNMIYLRKIKKLDHLGLYVVYAPSFVVRLLIGLGSFIIKPDLVLKTQKEYQDFLGKLC